jgi:anti-anti-sigma regulatory factor
MRDRGGVLVLESPSEKVRRLLEVTGLTEHLELR